MSAANSFRPRLLVDIVSDPVCPWCFVGLNAFFIAKETLSETHDVVARLRPYQLNPDTPLEGADRRAYYAKKFPDPAFRDDMRAQLMAAAEDAGAPFDPMGPTHLPNTLAAHRVLRWAHFDGLHEALARRLYEAFWLENADIGDAETLAGLAADVGMDGAQIGADLATEKDAKAVAAEAQAFRNAGVSGVPTFIVNEKTGFSGALPPEKLSAALKDAAAHDAEAHNEAG
ncbi:MAG: DsbA family oxidoreductase [Pseudomonadota bacterium]